MKGEDNKDILMDKALKGNPYSTPEGYFDSFKVKAESFTRPKTVSVNIWQQLKSYVAVAAMFIFMVTAGTFFLKKTTPIEDFDHEDYIVFSEGYFDFEVDTENEEQYADADISADDIIEYLIYIGVNEETIELSK